MLLIISPAKTLDFESRQAAPHSLPVMLEQSQELVDGLKQFNPAQIAEFMGISEKLAQLNWQRYQDFKAPFDLDNAKQALLAFKGDVYNGIEAAGFTEADLTFAQDHVRILSGLYGVLRPLDLMQPYRLEMGTRFSTSRGKNLYDFWGTRVTETLNADLQRLSHPVLVNLASDEYFKVIHPNILQVPLLKISFKENKNGTYKVISIHAKRARGLMVNFVVTNRLANIEELQDFNSEGYQFNPGLSKDEELVFCRG